MPRRSAEGVKKRNKGNEFEKLVRAVLRQLEDEGICKLWKLPTDLRLVGGDKLVRSEAMPSDFMGFSLKTGRAILLELKDVEAVSLPIGRERSHGLSPHQAQAAHIATVATARYWVAWKRDERFIILGGAALFRHERIAWEDYTPFRIEDLGSQLRSAMMWA